MIIRSKRLNSKKGAPRLSRTLPRNGKATKIQLRENFWGADYGDDWEKQRKLALARDGKKCRSCGHKPRGPDDPNKLHVHHLVSRSKGGTNALRNLIVLCARCHQRQHKHRFT